MRRFWKSGQVGQWILCPHPLPVEPISVIISNQEFALVKEDMLMSDEESKESTSKLDVSFHLSRTEAM